MKTFNLVLLSCLFSLHAFAGEPRYLSENEWLDYQEKGKVIFRFLCADSLQQADSAGILKVKTWEGEGLKANCSSGTISAQVDQESAPLSSLSNEIVSEIGAFLVAKNLDLKSLYIFQSENLHSIILDVHDEKSPGLSKQILFRQITKNE